MAFSDRLPGILSFIAGLLLLNTSTLCAQDILSKKISLNVSQQPLSEVLKQISKQGNFYFSYNSSIVPQDSLVTLSAGHQSIQQILDRLFNSQLEYRVNNSYIILRKTAVKSRIITGSRSTENLFTVTGQVLNGQTGTPVSNVSIYDKQHLVTTLSDNRGHFSIKLKSRYTRSAITASRVSFEDTSIVLQPAYNQELIIAMEPVSFSHSVVTIGPADYNRPDSIIISAQVDTVNTALLLPPEKVTDAEKTTIGKLLISTRQQIQSLNLNKFFADRPFQVSLIPGFGTHGKLSGQVINNFSLNILGGYTGGVEGVELGGLFNINTKHARYLQAAGLFNIAGGPMTGAQLAGIHNTVLKPAMGFQAAGISNFVKGKFTGWQISGIHNHISDSLTGVQASGITNYARKKVTGLQMAGIGNFSNREMTGAQLAGIFNYAKKLKGLQIGLINIADTSEGYSLGLINIVFKGYHKLAFYTNEVFPVNAAFKTGNKKLYSILLAGGNSEATRKAVSFGYGLGTELALGKRFAINPELTTQYLYLGNEHYSNFLNRMTLQFTVNFGKYFSVFAGPSFSIYYSDQLAAVEGYQFEMPSATYRKYDLWNEQVTGWIGWHAGISFF